MGGSCNYDLFCQEISPFLIPLSWGDVWDDEGRFDDMCARGEQGLESLEGGVSPREGGRKLCI